VFKQVFALLCNYIQLDDNTKKMENVEYAGILIKTYGLQPI